MDIISQMKKIWPDWTVVDKIGAGSYGHVYKVSRIVADRTYYSAAKVITVPQNEGEVKAVFAEEGSHSATKAHFKELVDDCIREITIMMDLRGASNVVEVEDFKVIEYENEIRWDIFIRMEYLTCLTDIITQRKLSEKEVAKIGVDLCSALEICEKKQVIHRDIKPGNIFVSEFGTYKLGDFGIAREMDRASGTLSSRGTYDYMAPEMFRGMRYDATVDLYALGIVLYKLMNRNRAPFLDPEAPKISARDKEAALGRRISGEKLPAPCDASALMSGIILKACSADPADRFRTPGQMKVLLENILNERPDRAMYAPENDFLNRDEYERTVPDPDMTIQDPDICKHRREEQSGKDMNIPRRETQSGDVMNISGRNTQSGNETNTSGRNTQSGNETNTNYAGFTPNSIADEEDEESEKSRTVAYAPNGQNGSNLDETVRREAGIYPPPANEKSRQDFSEQYPVNAQGNQNSKGRCWIPTAVIVGGIALLAAVFFIFFIYRPLPGPVHPGHESGTDGTDSKKDSAISALTPAPATDPAETAIPAPIVIPAPTAAPGSAFRFLDESVGYDSIAIGFRKGDEELASLVSGAIEALVLDGTYDKLGEKYPDVKNYLYLRPEGIDASAIPERGSGDHSFVFRQGVDLDYPPYSRVSDDGNVEGFDVDLCKAVCEYLGWEYEGVAFSWDEKDMNLNSDACDCIWSGFTKEGREEDYTWGITYAADAYFVLVQSDSDIYTTADLNNKVVGVLEGSRQYDLGAVSGIKEYTDFAPMANDLKAGTIDAAVVDSTIGQFIIKNY